MPLTVTEGLPTILVRKDAFERASLNRTEIDSLFNLTDGIQSRRRTRGDRSAAVG